MSELFRRSEKTSNLLDEVAFQSNQRGEITAYQGQNLKIDELWKRLILLLIATPVINGIFGFIIFNAISDDTWYTNLPFILILSGISLLTLCYWSYHLWLEWQKSNRLKRDIANNAIRQGQGQLSHDKKGYAFELNTGPRLRLPTGVSNGLVPGVVYQLFYLEESGFCLSANEIDQTSPLQVQHALNTILCSANGFSSEDLLANQNNEVTFAQRKKPLESVLTGAIIVLVFMIFLIPFILQPFSGDPVLSVFAVAMIVILVGILPFIGAVMLLDGLIDFAFPRLQQIQDKAHKEIRVSKTKNQSVHYYYVIGEKRFEVNKTAYTALIDGLEYRIYYLPRTKKLISIEHILSRVTPSIF